MFYDKTPINWKRDSPWLVLRKIARCLAAAPFILWGMEQMTGFLEKAYPSRKVLRPLYRWIQGSYMFRGYREGLNEHV